MNEVAFFDILRQGLWVSVVMAAPMLGAALIAGLGVGLVQALTSVQEMTLTFVPKIIAMLAVFWVSMSFMSGMLVKYFHAEILPLVVGS
ncbi:flagellar biosynthetic protein FliQ [Pararhodobacter sp.]|uniref:flagellar biosynthetic protein FliQ n=1 Tax=Pararhodobacter sp. TaxID=2127056 RepID=UPI002FDD0DD1